jgi:hypothetical protein
MLSTLGGLRGLFSICRIDDTTSGTVMSFMQRRSKSHLFARQHGAHGTAE